MKRIITQALLIISASLAVATTTHAQVANYSLATPNGAALANISGQFSSPAVAPAAAVSDANGVLASQPMPAEFMIGLEGSNIIPTYFAEPNWSPRRLVVNTQNSQQTVRMNGATQGFQPKNLDGQVDFAMVMSALKKSDVLAFDLRKILSDETDPVKIYLTEFQIPSNLTLPRQTEFYILPITLEKPNFRLSLPQQANYNIFTLRGQFSLEQVMQGSTGSSSQLYQLLNYLKITGGSIKTLAPAALNTPVNLQVNEITFNEPRLVPMPVLQGGETLLAMALNRVSDFYLPSDMRLTDGTGIRNLQLNFMPKANPYVAYIVKNQTELDPQAPGLDRLTLQLAPVAQSMTIDTIDLLNTPTLSPNGQLQIALPQQPAIVKSTRQLVQVSKITLTNENGKQNKHYQRVTEIWFKQWQNTVQFPKPLAELCQHCRIDVSLMGSTEENLDNDEVQWIEKATHVSHVSLEY